MDPHTPTFDAMSIDPLWLDFTAAESIKVDSFFAMWQLEDGATILEPGCGTGRLTARLAACAGPRGRVLACDRAPQMIAKARARNLPAWVEFRQAPVLDLDLPPASFDSIICFNVLPHLVPLPIHLALFQAWLKPGRRLWICHTASRAYINSIHAEAGMNDHLLPDLPTLSEQIAQAGLRLVDAHDGEQIYWACAEKM